MAIEPEKESYLELIDVSTKAQIASVPLALVRFLPRAGERIFFPGPRTGQGNWVSYKVIEVEYLIGYDIHTGKAAIPAAGGIVRVTLYVEASR